VGLIKITQGDKYFSLCVRERAEWRCQYPGCGKQYPPPTQGLHCAHVMSRGHWSVRFDPHNAIALCYGHHRIAEQRREVEFLPLVKSLFGEAQWHRVFAEAYKGGGYRVKRSLPEIAKHYREQLKAMQAKRADGHIGLLDFEGWQ
jgi:hypothetical protein